MTYLEKITYLTGKYLQITQFVLKNAYRLVSLSFAYNNKTPYLQGSSILMETGEVKAKEFLSRFASSSSEDVLHFFKEQNALSKMDMKNLEKVLKKRDYLVSTFYLENTPAFAREEMAIYESKIAELEEYNEMASKLNVSLSKACDRLCESF